MSSCPQDLSTKRKMKEDTVVPLPQIGAVAHAGTLDTSEKPTLQESTYGPPITKQNRATSAPMTTKEEMQRMGYRIVAEGTGVLSKRRVVIWSKKNVYKRY